MDCKKNDYYTIQGTFAKLQCAYWLDDAFRLELTTSPKEVLIANGFPVPDGASVQVRINTATQGFLIIPQQPKNISSDQLNELQEAGTFGTGGTVGSAGTFCGCAGTFGTVGTFGCADL